MAKIIKELSVGIRLVPDDDTMNVILNLLDLWQDAEYPDFRVKSGKYISAREKRKER